MFEYNEKNGRRINKITQNLINSYKGLNINDKYTHRVTENYRNNTINAHPYDITKSSSKVRRKNSKFIQNP